MILTHTMVRCSAALLASSVLALAGCSSSSDGSDAPAPSAAYVGTMTFQSGKLQVSCQGAPPMAFDLTRLPGTNAPGYFTNTATGDATFHHEDDNDCEFDFTVDGASASTTGTCTTVPDGRGGKTTFAVAKMTFTPTPDGKGLSVDGNGTYAGCPMTIEGVAQR